jgi:riboflavin biosynthesis pyrimidine reductase
VKSLEILLDTDARAGIGLPPELRALYDGDLSLDAPLLYANFVSTLDGVAAIRPEPRSNRLISSESEADRFVMGLLRACAGAVLIGSGTLHGSPKTLWTAERAFPVAAPAFAELRTLLELAPTPELAVLSASGSVDTSHPALESGALVLTTEDGAARLRGRLPEATEITVLGSGSAVDPRRAVDYLRERGHRRILSEAGPHVFGSLLAAGLVDELFLTISPLLAGRSDSGMRLSLVEGQELLPGNAHEWRLVSLRRHGNHIFLRHRLEHT